MVVGVRGTKKWSLGVGRGKRKKTTVYEYIDFSLLLSLPLSSFLEKKREGQKKNKEKKGIDIVHLAG